MSSRKVRKGKNRKHRHALLILFLTIGALFFLYREFEREDVGKKGPVRQGAPGRTVTPRQAVSVPRIAVVIDDLGPGREAAMELFGLNIPLTISVLPLEAHTKWIAEEAHGLGYTVLGHLPMEAKRPVSLEKGGLYTWMTEGEIRETLENDLTSIPHLQGVSNHMGSAFTEDGRVMDIFMSVLKEHDLFFLDSYTTNGSVGLKAAEKHGVKVIKRDIFLDNEGTPGSFETRWEQALKTAGEKGYAVAIAHARGSTVDFLRKTLPSDRATVVPLTDLIDELRQDMP